MMNSIRGPSSKEPLTWREIEILHLIQEGCSNKEISQKLSLTVETVKWYNQQIYGKLGVTSRTQAIEKGYDAGILKSHQPFSPPISTFPSRHIKHNLPAPLSSFIGRKKELADLRAVLNGSTARLITILGPGGIGKTRLALLAAHEALAFFEHGVWLVDLAALTDPGLLAQTVLHTLKIENHEQLSDEEALVQALRDQALLLILDNCEHLVETCARLVRLLLAGCPNMRILITSREVLGVEGELHYPLHALAFPDPQQLPNIKAFRNYEAVQLFIARVVQVCPEYAITQHNISTIAQVCRRLEGIPLALELAAARTSLLSVEEIDAHLDDCFSMLAQTGLVVDPRHHTMQAALDWSYNLLREPEQILLRRLAVFSRGWTVAAAEAICAEPGILPSGQILDMLNSLVNKSMVVAEHLPGQETRCRLLEPICQYLVGKLEQAGETESIKARHLVYYLMLAKQAEPHLRTHLAVEWLNRLELDLDNFRSGLCFSLLTVANRASSSLTSDFERPIEKGLQLASSLVWFWGLRNHCIEGAEWLDRLIHGQQDQGWQQPLDSPARVTRARALYSLGIIITYSRGAINNFPPILIAQKQAFLRESLTIFHELGEATYLRDVAIVHYLLSETQQEYLECRELFQTLNERFWIAECDKELAFYVEQDHEMANFYLDENLVLRKEVGDLEGEGWALKIAAVMQFGNHTQYCNLMQRSLDCYVKLGNRWRAARERSLLVRYLIDLGDYQEAARQIGLMQVALSEFQDQTLLLHYLRYRGYLAWAKGAYQEAVDCGLEGLVLAHQMLSSDNLIYFFMYILVRAALSQRDVYQAREHLKRLFPKEMLSHSGWGWKQFFIFTSIHALLLLAAIEGKLEQAARLIGAQDALLEQDCHLMHRLTPRGRAEFEQAYEAIQGRLDDDTFTSAFQAGRVMTTEQLIQLAHVLCDTDPNNQSQCQA